jgi:germacradienol/geosmin synthase
VPFKKVGHLPLPGLYMPYQVRTSPHLEAARRHAVTWARETGFFDSAPGVEIGGLWDERRYRGFDFAHCAAMIHADASPERLEVSTDWLSWGTYADDYYPAVFGTVRDLAGARHCSERLTLLMPVDDDSPPMAAAGALERGLQDLWRRTAGPMNHRSRLLFRQAVEKMLAAWEWELANQAQHRIPDPVDYVEMRRCPFGSELTIALARAASMDVVPQDVYQSRTLRELETAAMDYGAFTNDLFSYQKEIEYQGEAHNMVLVVEKFLGVDRLRARDVVADLMAARISQFEHLADHELPALLDSRADLTPEARDALLRQAEDLKEWMSGILEWHLRCERYTEAELARVHGVPRRRDFPHRPTGLGTSALRAHLPAGSVG